jgi:hypothetical protein
MKIANENPTLTASGKAGLTLDESCYYSLALTMPKGVLFVKAILAARCARKAVALRYPQMERLKAYGTGQMKENLSSPYALRLSPYAVSLI